MKNKLRLVFNTLALILAVAGAAQISAQTPAPKVNIVIERNLIRFTTAEAATAARIEVSNQAGEPVFDSGLVSTQALEWPLRGQQGQPLASGLYAYTLTIHSQAGEMKRHGHVIVDRASQDDRIWVTSNSEVGVGAQSTEPELTVVGASDLTIGGAKLPGQSAESVQDKAASAGDESRVSASFAGPLKGAGTPGQIPLFTAADELGDSVITQSQNGSIGVGTASPGSKLTVAGEIDGTQYNLNGKRVLFTPGTHNTLVGVNAGFNTPTGIENTIVGLNAGRAGGGHNNAFFGTRSGFSNTGGSANSVFGSDAFFYNTSGSENAVFGTLAGYNNTTGSYNAYFGTSAGTSNKTGMRNTAVGYLAGNGFSAGNDNTFIGAASEGAFGITNAAAIGAFAQVAQSHSLVLGSIAGVNGASASVNVGIGTTAPQARLHVQGGKIFVGSAGQGLILKSPNGAICRELTISDAGAIVLKAIACP
jgi:hypothetical protein